MSTGAIIAVVVAVLVIAVVLVLVNRAAKTRALNARRTKAGELRSEAEDRSAEAEKSQALADLQDAKARKLQAEADEKAAVAREHASQAAESAEAAERDKRFIREKHAEASEIDPDVTADERELEPHTETSRTNGH